MTALLNRCGVWLFTVAVLGAASGFAQPAPEAMAITTLYSFTGDTDGAYPDAPLVYNPADLALWGITSGGGSDFASYGCGTIFRMVGVEGSGGGYLYEQVYQFPGDTPGLCYPNSLTVTASGLVYGTTWDGAVFQVLPAGTGWTANVLYTFNSTDGPLGVLVTSKGALIGVTQQGGGQWCGDVFELRQGATAWQESELYRFKPDPAPDGCNPLGKLTAHNGALFGVTTTGPDYNHGTVFMLSSSQGSFGLTVLHTFSSSEGYPVDGVTFGPDGTLYGITNGGGTNNRGFVYALQPPDSGSYSVIDNLSFGNGGGAARLIATKAGVLYGVTNGTNTGTKLDYARVFSLLPPAGAGQPWTQKALAAFSNGDCPSASLTLTGQGLLGVTTGSVPYNGCYGSPTDQYGSVYWLTKQ